MKQTMLGLAAAVTVLASCAAAAAQAQGPGDAARGKPLFAQDGCYSCHGTVGEGGGFAGPRLAHVGLTAEAILQELRNPAAQMPPYTEKVLPDPDAADIIAYVLSLSASPAPTGKDIAILDR